MQGKKKMIQMEKIVISNNIQILTIRPMKISMKTHLATKGVNRSANKYLNHIKVILNVVKKKTYKIFRNKRCRNRNNNRIIKK
jgi:hypothetical protein